LVVILGSTAAAQPGDTQGAGQHTSIAIVGADVYTVTHEVVRRGTVLVRDGKIARVGQDVPVPEGFEVIEAQGKYVCPGFIAITADRVAVTGNTSGSNKIADALDPFDRSIEFCLGSGITTACVRPGRGFARFRGRRGGSSASQPTQHAVVKMTYGELPGMLVRESPFYWVSSSSLTGALNRFNWRENLKKAKKYVADYAQYEKDKKQGKDVKEPKRPVSEEIVKLVRGELRLRTDAGTTDEIRDMIALAKEFGYRLVLDGVHESWLVAEELGEARVPVVLTPRSRRQPELGREDSSGSSIETSRILEKAGVPFAVSTLSGSVSLGGLAGRDLTSLPLEAAFAVRGGCRETTALAAITIVPAQMLGLDDAIGSIEQGKDADLLILDGPPLDYRTYVETALVNGKVYYERSKNRIYPVFDRKR
jgi:imidazolonepropionase-like amidohydrolase